MELSDNEKRDIQKYIEAGKQQNPTIETLTKIAKALEVGVDEVIK